jgi:pilus assembly protein Flp/PilA
VTHFTTTEVTNTFHLTHLALSRFILDESGQDIIEYALLAALVGLASVIGINGIAAKISSALSAVYTSFGNIVAGALH